MKYVLIAAILIVIGFVIALQYIPIGIEPLTEVYLENHATMPTGGLVNKSYNYTFSVHNLEYREMNYTYEVVIEYSNRSLNLSDVSIERGEFSLLDNETITVQSSYFFPYTFDRAKVKTLVYKDNNESIDIHFWINEVIPFRVQIINDSTDIRNNTVSNSG